MVQNQMIMKGVWVMARKGENIHRRRDGRWEGRFQKGRDSNGRIIYGSVYGKTYREVKEKKTLVIINSDEVQITNGKDKCFKEVCELWLNSNRIRYKGATENRYQNLLDRHIIPEFGDVKISQISAPMINEFLMKKLERGRIDESGGLSAAYVRSIMLIISSILRFAVEEQFCQPLKSPIFKPSTCKDIPKILDIQQQTLLESYLLCDINNTKIGILITLHGGLRIGEICALSWDDINLQDAILHVRHTIARVKNPDTHTSSMLIIDTPKTKASVRDIPISSLLIPILEEAKRKSHSPYVISDSSSFISPRTYEYRFHKILEKCGIEQINYHALRHTFATRCIEAGVDAKSLSEILGHSNVSITLNTYVHSSIEMKRIQLEKLNFFASAKENINGQKNGIKDS